MAATKRKWLKGCALGCGGVALLAVLIVGISFLLIHQLANRAVETLETLESTYETQSDYTPPIDGGIPGERIERFLEVRRRLMTFCDRLSVFTDTFQGIGRKVDELKQEKDEEPEAKDLLPIVKDGGSLIGGMFRLGRDLAKFSITRNQALLEGEMGLGEYTWIYVAGYYGLLGQTPAKFSVAKETYPRIFFDRVLGDVREMIRRHVAALEGLLERAQEPERTDLEERLAVWRAELDAMTENTNLLPFQRGIPPELESSLEPFRQELEELFCPATSELEIMRTVKRGLKHEHL
jgi:hypothetical protein